VSTSAASSLVERPIVLEEQPEPVAGQLQQLAECGRGTLETGFEPIAEMGADMEDHRLRIDRGCRLER
jgi:hypothetical protein